MPKYEESNVNELKCPALACGALMGTGTPYVTLSALSNVRSVSPKWLETRTPDGYKFECPSCGCTVDIPATAEQVPA